MAMKLRCQSEGTNCPPFKHSGVFNPSNENIKRLLPDLKQCANCTAYVAPTLPSFRDDLLQIASITLFEKGPAFNPEHESRASFGTFIRPRICVSLMNAKRKELRHQRREQLEPTNGSDMHETADIADDTPLRHPKPKGFGFVAEDLVNPPSYPTHLKLPIRSGGKMINFIFLLKNNKNENLSRL